MSSIPDSCPVPGKGARIAGWILTLLPIPLMLFSTIGKIRGGPEVEQGFAHLGVPMSQGPGLAILELACIVIYLIPRTAVLGAILLTGYLGGAIQTHIRVGDPVYTHILLGVVFWGGIFLRDPRLRKLIPLRCG